MTEAQTPPNPRFDMEKIYLKDVSFESPNTPGVFLQKEFNPKIEVDMDVEHVALQSSEYFEVTLTIEVRAKSEDTTAFLVSVQQAGIFRLQNFPEEQLQSMLYVACPNTLMPFIREAVASLVTKGGFPQLLLAPVNFEMLFAQKLKERNEAVVATEAATTH